VAKLAAARGQAEGNRTYTGGSTVRPDAADREAALYTRRRRDRRNQCAGDGVFSHPSRMPSGSSVLLRPVRGEAH